MLCSSCGRNNPEDSRFCNECGANLDIPTDASSGIILEEAVDQSNPHNSGFVGRSREMAELKSALDDALSGQGRLVMLAGEPGVGKTRTAQELASYANGQGAQVWWGRCYEEEGSPPYWPWIQIVRSSTPGRHHSVMRPDSTLFRSTLEVFFIRRAAWDFFVKSYG